MLKETLVLAALTLGQVPTIVDGDTVRIAGVRIRLVDYDSPELFSPKCPRERELAWKAKQELERIIGQVKLELVPCATTNWGRLCAEGTIEGKPLATHMIGLGLGSPYVCWMGGCSTPRGQNAVGTQSKCFTPRSRQPRLQSFLHA
jgi:endonuclease YncB( thermonuclease family)